MKKLFKTLAVIAALTLGFGFASCSFNGGGDGGSGSTATSSSTATTTAGGNVTGKTTGTAIFHSSVFWYGTIQLAYNADGTYLMTWSLDSYNASRATNKGRGTYTLDGTFENGTIHQHQTHESDTLSTSWDPKVEDNDLVITNGKFNVQIEGANGMQNVTFTKVN